MAGMLKGRGAAILAGLGLVAVVGFTAASWRTMAVAWEERKLLQDLDLIPEACKSPDDSVAADALRKVLHQSFEARQRVVQEFVRAARKNPQFKGLLDTKRYCYAVLCCDESGVHAFTCKYRPSVHVKLLPATAVDLRSYWPWVAAASGEIFEIGGTARVHARIVSAADANKLSPWPWLKDLPGDQVVCLLENQLYELKLENLVRLFQSSEKDVRGQAALLFGKLGAAGVPAIPMLLKALESKDSDMQLAAAEALAGLGVHAASVFPEMLRIADLPESGWASKAIRDSQARDELISQAMKPEHDIATRLRAISYTMRHDDDSFDPHRFFPQLEVLSAEPDPIGAAAREAIEATRRRDSENKSP